MICDKHGFRFETSRRLRQRGSMEICRFLFDRILKGSYSPELSEPEDDDDTQTEEQQQTVLKVNSDLGGGGSGIINNRKLGQSLGTGGFAGKRRAVARR